MTADTNDKMQIDLAPTEVYRNFKWKILNEKNLHKHTHKKTKTKHTNHLAI